MYSYPRRPATPFINVMSPQHSSFSSLCHAGGGRGVDEGVLWGGAGYHLKKSGVVKLKIILVLNRLLNCFKNQFMKILGVSNRPGYYLIKVLIAVRGRHLLRTG